MMSRCSHAYRYFAVERNAVADIGTQRACPLIRRILSIRHGPVENGAFFGKGLNGLRVLIGIKDHLKQRLLYLHTIHRVSRSDPCGHDSMIHTLGHSKRNLRSERKRSRRGSTRHKIIAGQTIALIGIQRAHPLIGGAFIAFGTEHRFRACDRLLESAQALIVLHFQGREF